MICAGFVRRELRAVGLADGGGLFEDGKAERLDVLAPEHGLPLQRQRGDRIGDRVDQELPPCAGGEIGIAHHAHRRSLQQRLERPCIRVVADGEFMVAGTAEADAIRRQPLAIVIDDGRNHGGVTDQGRQPFLVPDAVLQDGDAGLRRAQPLQPWRARRRVMRLGAQQHPVHRAAPGPDR